MRSLLIPSNALSFERIWQRAIALLRSSATPPKKGKKTTDIASKVGQTAHANSIKPGHVFLVGAGCGDADLITLKGLKAIRSAQVLLVDNLVHPDIYAYFPAEAEVVFVGKQCGQPSISQADICQKLLDHAIAGLRVVRLKGGDPSLFARLDEETGILEKYGIPFSVVPGISAALGCAAYAGIPLTHRECAQGVRFLTAHRKWDQDLNWSALADTHDTLVFYMGLSKLPMITEKLLSLGTSPNKPIAVIDQGATQAQVVVCASLASVTQTLSQQPPLKGPALIIIGEVVNYRRQVNNEFAHLSTTRVNELSDDGAF